MTKIAFPISTIVALISAIACGGPSESETPSDPGLTATPVTQVSSADRVYSRAARDIADEELQAFYIDPPVERPKVGARRPTPPKSETPAGFNQRDWVFEGYRKLRSSAEREEADLKRQKIASYMNTLSDEDRQALEERVHKQAKEKRRQRARERGESFDARDALSVAIFTDGQVWRKLAPQGYVPNSARGEVHYGVASGGMQTDPVEALASSGKSDPNVTSAPGTIVQALSNDDLLLRSAWNGYNLASYPWRTHGCISSSLMPSDCNCSGTKISARMVITAGHCLTEGEKDWQEGQDVWIPGVDGAGAAMSSGISSIPNGQKYRSASVVHSNWWDYEWENYDMGVFVLRANQSSCDLGWLGYDYVNGLTNEVVNMWGVPGPTQTCENSPLSSYACNASIYGNSGEVATAGTHSFRYDIYSYPGMSGAGVYLYTSDGHRYVIGTNIQKTPNYARACKINSGKLEMLNDTRDDYPDSSAGC